MEREDVKTVVLAIAMLLIFCFLWFKTDKWEYGTMMILVGVMLLDFAMSTKKDRKRKYEVREIKPYLCSECVSSGEKIGKDLYGCVC